MTFDDLAKRFAAVPVQNSENYRLASLLFCRWRDRKTLATFHLLQEVIEELCTESRNM